MYPFFSFRHIALFGMLVSGACTVFLLLSHVIGLIIKMLAEPKSPLNLIKWDDLGVGIGVAVGCAAYMFLTRKRRGHSDGE
jgi:cytosine/uracil/thiamine/allantoin permease